MIHGVIAQEGAARRLGISRDKIKTLMMVHAK